MKKIIPFLLIVTLVYLASCRSNTALSDSKAKNTQQGDTIRIVNDSLEYEVVIIEPGFNAWLVTQQPRGFYAQSSMEISNYLDVIEYNLRSRRPERFDPDLYPFPIDYRKGTDYGYEVNYLLFHYFMYFEQKYNQKLR